MLVLAPVQVALPLVSRLVDKFSRTPKWHVKSVLELTRDPETRSSSAMVVTVPIT